MLETMPKIVDCNADKCSYNSDNKCHAMAITVGGPGPICDTVFETSIKGGVPDMSGGVGACKIMDCCHNEMLECSAREGIHVRLHENQAECETFEEK